MGGFDAFQLAGLEMDSYQHGGSLYKLSGKNQKVEEAVTLAGAIFLQYIF